MSGGKSVTCFGTGCRACTLQAPAVRTYGVVTINHSPPARPSTMVRSLEDGQAVASVLRDQNADLDKKSPARSRAKKQEPKGRGRLLRCLGQQRRREMASADDVLA